MSTRLVLAPQPTAPARFGLDPTHRTPREAKAWLPSVRRFGLRVAQAAAFLVGLAPVAIARADATAAPQNAAASAEEPPVPPPPTDASATSPPRDESPLLTPPREASTAPESPTATTSGADPEAVEPTVSPTSSPPATEPSIPSTPAPLEVATEPPPSPPTTSTLLRKRDVPPFWFNREYDTHRTRAIAFPPLFVHRKPKPGHPERFVHADLSLTFGWYATAKERRRWINPVFMFFGGFSTRKTVWGAPLLLMGYRRIGEQFNFGQFPLVWWWGTKFVKNFFAVPFHYQQKTPDGFMGVSALLFWYGHKDLGDANLENDKRHFVAAPLFWRFDRGPKRYDFAFLYVGGHDKLEGKRYGAVAPFAFWQRTEFGNRSELWTWAWIKRNDIARRRSAWAVPLLLTFNADKPDRRVLSVTPLVWHTENRLRGSRLTLVGPVGSYRDPQQRNQFVAPLYYRFHDQSTDATTQILLPLFVSRRVGDDRAVWTLLGGGRRTSHGWAGAFPPALTFMSRSDDGRRTSAFLGLVWHAYRPSSADKPGRNLWVVGPLAFYDRRQGRAHLGLIPLLSYASWDEHRRLTMVTPLFWRVRDDEAQARTTVFGPIYAQRRADGASHGFAPIWFAGRRGDHRYAVLPWLLTGVTWNPVRHERSFTSPWFVLRKTPEQQTIGVLALGWDVQRPDERHTAIVPIFYRRQIGDRALVLTPIGGHRRHGDTATSVFGPFAMRKTAHRKSWGLLPIVFHDRTDEQLGHVRQTGIVPVFYHRRSDEQDLDMWTPLVWRSRVGGERPRRGLAIIPLYFRQRQPGGVDVDSTLAFFYSRDKHRRTHTLLLGPGFHRLSRKALDAGIVPLYWWHDAEKKRRLLALPAIFHFADKVKHEHTTIAVPLWFDRKRADGRRNWAAFPVVFGGKRRHDFTRFSLAPPGFVDVFRLGKNRRFTAVLPFYFRQQTCGFRIDDDPKCRYEVLGSFPFFLRGKGHDRTTHGALVYYWDKDPGGYRLYTPLFGISQRPGELLGWYAGIVGVRTTTTHRRIFAFPLFFHRRHRLEDQRLTLVVPPLFVSRHRKDRRFFEAGLLVWQVKQQHKVTTAVVPPLFVYSHAYEERKLLWVAPLFIRDNQIAKDEAWFAIPVLYTQRRRGKDFDFVQFPLVWHFERGTNAGTLGAFVWWDFQVKGKRLQMVPGAYLRWATPSLDTKVVGPGLGWWSRGTGVREGDRSWRALFGLFGAGIEGGRRYVALFGRKIDRGPAPTPTTDRRPHRGRRDRQAKLVSRRPRPTR